MLHLRFLVGCTFSEDNVKCIDFFINVSIMIMYVVGYMMVKEVENKK